MTLIECFDAFAPQNIAGCLYLQPEKLVLVGDKAHIEPFSERCRAFLADRGIRTRVECCPVPMDRTDRIVAALEHLFRQEPECRVDIAGGDERIVMAVGMALMGLEEKRRQRVVLQQFDLQTGTVRRLDGRADPVKGRPVRLRVEELVRLQGGILHPATAQPSPENTAADLDGLWDLVCRDSRAWNRNLSALGEFESRAQDKDRVCLSLRSLRGAVTDFDAKLDRVRTLLSQLHACGAIRDRSRGDCLEYAYTSPLMRACTLKAGNVLENKALLEARALRQDGEAFFHDCRMGVHIDWDGVVHDALWQIPETRNEVDLVLVRGATPLFVSCKNGDIGEGELYKLNTVAARFGGPYARKMLIATAVGGGQTAVQALRQRAKDMDIYLITDAAALSRRGWQDAFVQAMQAPAGGSED